MNLTDLTFRLCLSMFLAFSIFSSCDKNDPFEGTSGSFTDNRDGHEYKWVKIGEQIWMAENLAYVPYACAPDSQCGIWVYDYYGEGSFYENYHTYGCLYDWETAQTACPEGWHLPSDEEWMELERFLGMEESDLFNSSDRGIEKNIAGMLKTTESNFWGEDERDDRTGFSAIPGGRRDIWYTAGEFYFRSLGKSGDFWTGTENGSERALNRSIVGITVERESISKNAGFSIRCIKD